MMSDPLFSFRPLLAIVLLAGCAGSASAIKSSYRSSLERWPSGEVSRLLPPDGRAEIVTSTDIEGDAVRMMESGYLLLGRSRFAGEEVDPDAARDVAADLHASTVLLKADYAKTVREAIPIEQWVPARRLPAPRDASGASPGARGRLGPALQGEFRTTYQLRSVNYFDFAATFWAKSKPPLFGVLVERTGARTTEAAPSGQSLSARGVAVRAVILSSPAAQAGVLRDDVIVRFAGTDIVDPDQFFATVVANKGREVDVELVRVAESRVIKLVVPLKNEP